MRVAESILFGFAFLLIVGGSWLMFRDRGRLKKALDWHGEVAEGHSALAPDDPQRRWTAMRQSGDIARLSLAELLPKIAESSTIDRRGAILAVIGGLCALAGSLLAVWS